VPPAAGVDGHAPSVLVGNEVVLLTVPGGSMALLKRVTSSERRALAQPF
jgi:hypothetical protein